MKKRRLLTLLLLLLTLAALMASCKGEEGNILAQMKFQTSLQYKPTEAKVLTELDGTVYVDAFFHFVSVSRVNEDRSTTHLIYDYVAEKNVFTLTDPYDESGMENRTKLYLTYVGTSEDPLMLARADTLDYRDVCLKTVLYRLDNGEMLAELTSPTDTYRGVTRSTDGRFFWFGSKIYEMRDGEPFLLREQVSENESKLGYHYAYGDRLYVVSPKSVTVPNSVCIYDLQGEMLFGHQLPSYETMVTASPYVFSDGTLLFQTKEEVHEDETDYNLFDEGKKYRFRTYLMNAKNGDVEEVEFDYRILEFDSRLRVDPDSEYRFVHLLPIVNGYYDWSQDDYVLLDGELRIQSSMRELVPNLSTCIVHPNAGVLQITDAFGTAHLFDYDGNLIATFEKELGLTYGGYQYFTSTEGIYDRNFEKVFDLKAGDYTVCNTLYTGVILKRMLKEGIEYSMFADGKVTVIAPAGSPEANQFANSSSPYMYRLKNVYTPYRFYNTRGELLFESDSYFWTEHARSRDGYMLVKTAEHLIRVDYGSLLD